MTKSALLAIFGGLVVAVAITLNFVLEEAGPLSRESAAPTSATGEPPTKNLILKPESEHYNVPTRPNFDVVRINPAGDTVMAGRATPNRVIEILDGDKKIGEVTSDKRGEWVFVPTSPLPAGNRQLSLQMHNTDGTKTASEASVIMVVPERSKHALGRNSPAGNYPLAIKLPNGDTGLVEVLQKPNSVGTDGSISLVVDAIDYTEVGRLIIAGKAPAEAIILCYLNNNFIGRTIADKKALWNLRPQDTIPPGKYTLRADQVDSNGKVVARREVVFARSVPLTDVKPGTLIMVEPGNSLWRIARKTYGSGFKFTVIYDANKSQIKNEDLIYPGQVFALPPLD